MTRLVDPETQLIEQIRVNVAFEQMIFSVLVGAVLGGALTLLLNLGASLLGGVSFSGVIAALLETLLVSFLIFLVGFFSSIAVGAPLFMAMEKNKRRNIWPYLAAAMAIAVVAFAFSAGGLPVAGDLTPRVVVAIFVPALVIALMFSRGMRPHWRAAQKAEEQAETEAEKGSAGANIVRIH